MNIINILFTLFLSVFSALILFAIVYAVFVEGLAAHIPEKYKGVLFEELKMPGFVFVLYGAIIFYLLFSTSDKDSVKIEELSATVEYQEREIAHLEHRYEDLRNEYYNCLEDIEAELSVVEYVPWLEDFKDDLRYNQESYANLMEYYDAVQQSASEAHSIVHEYQYELEYGEE